MSVSKSIVNLPHLPKPALERAYALLAEQPYVPSSPGQADGSRYYFCAGAAIAAAGLSVNGSTKELEHFVEQLTYEKSSEAIVRVFADLGWDTDIARNAIGMNDSLILPERKHKLLACLKECLTQPTAA